MEKDSYTVLALYPNVRGLGFACLEIPRRIRDCGVITVRPIANGPILKRIKKYIEFYRPLVITLRGYEKPETVRSKRIRLLLESVMNYAKELNIPFHTYSRHQIREVFEIFGATTKYEIAHKIIETFPELADKAPKIQKPWLPEDYNMGIFDAMALCMVHDYLKE